MKFSIDRSALLSALQHVHSVVERRNTIPILSNVLIEAKEDGVYLTATDMDIAVIEKIDLEKSEVMQLGTITTSAQMLYDIVRTVTVQVIVQILFTMNNPSVSLISTSFIQTTLFLILGIMVFWLVIYKFLSNNHLDPLFPQKNDD